MQDRPREGGVATRLKRKNYSMQKYVGSFVISIILTAIAFAAVATNVMTTPYVIVMFITLLAVIQVIFQMVFWMHLSEKGHQFPKMFMISFIVGGLVVVFGIFLMLKWVDAIY